MKSKLEVVEFDVPRVSKNGAPPRVQDLTPLGHML